MKNRYIGRTFIAPSQEMRALGVRMKLNPLSENIAGKRLVVVDDSIVRGTTQRAAREHAARGGRGRGAPADLVAAVKWPCFYGMDTGDRGELLAANLTVDEIRDYLNVDTLAYLTLDRLIDRHRRRRRGLLRRLLHRATTRSRCRSACARACSSATTDARQASSSASRARAAAADDRLRRRCADRWADATRTPASTSPPARKRSSASRTRCARRSGPRSSATSAASAACSPSPQHRYRNPVLVSSTDGVGTKALVAQAAGRFDTIGVDLVAMCVDDLVCQGAEPLFFLDYIAVGQLDPDHIEQLVEGVAEGCRQAGCALIGGEMAEHPGAMEPGEFDLVGFAVGVAERDRSSPASTCAPGDVLIGLPSPGPALATATRWPAGCCSSAPGRRLDDPAFAGRAPHAGRRAARAVGDLRARPSPRCSARGRRARRRPHHRRRHRPATSPGCCPTSADAVVDRALVGGAPDLRRDPAARRGRPTTRWRKVFNLGIGMVVVVPRGRRLPRPRRAARGQGHRAQAIGRSWPVKATSGSSSRPGRAAAPPPALRPS